QAAEVAAHEVADAARDPRRKRPQHVGALAREPVASAGRGSDLRLRDALGEAARTEVGPRRAVCGHGVLHPRARLEDELAAGDALPGADAELCLLAADRLRADTPDA